MFHTVIGIRTWCTSRTYSIVHEGVCWTLPGLLILSSWGSTRHKFTPVTSTERIIMPSSASIPSGSEYMYGRGNGQGVDVAISVGAGSGSESYSEGESVGIQSTHHLPNLGLSLSPFRINCSYHLPRRFNFARR